MIDWNACTQEPGLVLRWMECHPGTAAYLQVAVLFLALIVIAVGLSHYGIRKADGRPRQRLLTSARAIGAEIQACFANASAQFNGDNDKAVEFVRSVDAYHRFKIASAALDGLPVHHMPSYETTQAVIVLQRLMAEGQKQIDAAFQEVSMLGQIQQPEAFAEVFLSLGARAQQELDTLYSVSENS